MDSAHYKAAAELWAARVAEAYRTADGASLDDTDRQTLASYVIEKISTCIILCLTGAEWGFMQVNPKIGEWENVRRLRRGYRLLSVNEGDGTVVMGLDPRAR